MPILLLPPHLIYQIAAGEVIDRPSSIVKELLENAIDAQASSVWVSLREGGETYISVRDDGAGMSPDEIECAIQHHTTSKIVTDNLEDIKTLGFRGEALPSIAAVSRMSITSKCKEDEWGWHVQVNEKEENILKPLMCKTGTHVEVRDLFYKTPNRLKFLKTPEWEFQSILMVFKRLAMGYPSVSFTLRNNHRTLFHFPAASFERRVQDVVGEAFMTNSLNVNETRGFLKMKGFISLPTLTQSTAHCPFLFVNGRPVHNKLLSSALRVAYEGLLFRNRFPVVVLFLDIPTESIDVNVHPKKHEVRFKEAAFVQKSLTDILREILAQTRSSVSTTFNQETLSSLEAGDVATLAPFTRKSLEEEVTRNKKQPLESLQEVSHRYAPLGEAIGQLYKTYIISEKEERCFIIDQHAAHERILYEQIKESVHKQGLKISPLSPPLLLKEKPDAQWSILLKHQEELKHFGLELNFKDYPSVLEVKGTPEVLGDINAEALITDLAEEIRAFGEPLRLTGHVHRLCATLSCHLSIRGGEALTPQQLNKLLRQIESVNYSGQCPHGRPTYVSLEKRALERIFRRKG